MEVSRLMDHGSKCQSHRAAEHVTFFFAKTLSDKAVLCQLKRDTDTAACRDLLERLMRHYDCAAG